MKNREIITAYNTLSMISLRKVEKQTKQAILQMFTKFSEPVEKINAQKKILESKLFEDEKIKTSVEEVFKLREEFKTATRARQIEINEIIVSQHSEFLEIEKEFVEAYNMILDEDTKVSIARIGRDKFIDALDHSLNKNQALVNKNPWMQGTVRTEHIDRDSVYDSFYKALTNY